MATKKPILPRNFLKLIRGARRVVIIGIGNPMKADDGLGSMCAELIFHELLRKPQDRVKVIVGGEVPEKWDGQAAPRIIDILVRFRNRSRDSSAPWRSM